MDEIHVTHEGHDIGLPSSCFDPKPVDLPDAPQVPKTEKDADQERFDELLERLKSSIALKEGETFHFDPATTPLTSMLAPIVTGGLAMFAASMFGKK